MKLILFRKDLTSSGYVEGKFDNQEQFEKELRGKQKEIKEFREWYRKHHRHMEKQYNVPLKIVPILRVII